MKVSLLVFAGVLLAPIASHASPLGEKPRVCTITIQSPEEIKRFRQELGNDFEFVEIPDLVRRPDGTMPKDWFSQACDSKIAGKPLDCDVLVVSAHFGGLFFSDPMTFEITMQDLEQQACNSKCGGILRDPSEIFLLGCNTLATKSEDGRSMDDYYAALHNDHNIARADAEWSVITRYMEIGATFEDQITTLFNGPHNIYGFASRSPLGSHSAPAFDLYLRAKQAEPGGYRAWLDKLKAERLYAQMTADERTHASTPRFIFNDELDQYLDKQLHSSLTERPGALPGDAKFDYFRKVCTLKDERNPTLERLQVIEGLVNAPKGNDYLKSVLLIESFTDAHPEASLSPPEREVFERIKNSGAARKQTLALLDKVARFPVVQLHFANFATRMGWLPAPGYDTLEQIRARDLGIMWQTRSPTMPKDDAYEICNLIWAGLKAPGDVGFNTQNTAPDGKQGGFILSACIQHDDPAVQRQVAQLLTSSTKEVVLMADKLFNYFPPTDPQARSIVVAAYDHGAPWKSEFTCTRWIPRDTVNPVKPRPPQPPRSRSFVDLVYGWWNNYRAAPARR